MKKVLVAVLVFLFFLPCNEAARADNTEVLTATKGILDLSKQALTESQIVQLDGEWEFYWENLLEPADFQAGISLANSRTYTEVPAEWKDIQPEANPLPNQGYATYRLRILLNDADRNTPKALYMPSVASAYKLWINGEFAAESGTVGNSAQTMVPKNYSRVIYVPAGSTQLELVMQVSNFVQRRGGMWQSIRLGLAEPILYERDKHLVYESFIAASLLIMGLYNIGLFVVRRSNRTSLYFGLLSITIGIRGLLLGETLAVRMIPQLDWYLAVKVEYLTSMAGVAFLLLFVQSQYPQDLNKKVGFVLLAGSISGSISIILTPALVYTSAMLVYQLFILASLTLILCVYLLAAVQKREGSILNGIGLFVFFLTCLNDTLYYQNLGTYENLVPLGLLFFLLTQMLNLAYKFAKAFAHVEKLSNELRQINSTLEKKVKERTIALESTNLHLEEINQELSTMEKSRRYLLSNISHELGTPLTSIQGFIKAMIDGVVKTDDPKYLHLIYDKTVFLNRIIHDLYELTKIETRRVSFHFKPVPLLPFIKQLFDKYVEEIEKKGLQFQLQTNEADFPDSVIMVTIDPIRIEQVFANLLVNASKFTPEGGVIRLVVEVIENTPSYGRARISIIDTGSGISTEDLPFIFDRFYKGSESRTRGSEGVGLGLAICKEIIDCHQGSIKAVSHLNEGSEFCFTLPVKLLDRTEFGEVS